MSRHHLCKISCKPRLFIRRRGVTLLEILLAFAILTLFLIPFLQAFLTTKKGTQMTGDYNQALYLAQKVVEDIRYCAYNEHSADFKDFMYTVTRDEDVDLNHVVPIGETVEGQTSAFFRETFHPDVDSVDGVLVFRMDKFIISTTWEEITLDSGETAPDAALVKVRVSWDEKLHQNDEIKTRSVYLSTVIGKMHHIASSGGGAAGP